MRLTLPIGSGCQEFLSSENGSLTPIAARWLVVVATRAMILTQVKPSRKYRHLVEQSKPAPLDNHRGLAAVAPLTLPGRPRYVVDHSGAPLLVGDHRVRAQAPAPKLF